MNAIQKNRDNVKNSRRTKHGLVTKIYNNQRLMANKRNHAPPSYTKQELRLWLTKQRLFHRLYNNWVASDYNRWLVPSVDRLKNELSYSFDNVKLGTWRENHIHGVIDNKSPVYNKQMKPVRGIHKITKKVVNYNSIGKACRKLNLHKTALSACCNGRQKSTGGYKWNFK